MLLSMGLCGWECRHSFGRGDLWKHLVARSIAGVVVCTIADIASAMSPYDCRRGGRAAMRALLLRPRESRCTKGEPDILSPALSEA